MGRQQGRLPGRVLLTTKGYAVASINYRLSQHAVFPAQIEDCKAAIRWLRANAAKYRPRPGPHRRLGLIGRRPSRRHARHHRQREGIGGHGREPRPVQPRAVRRRLVRSHGSGDDGQASRHNPATPVAKLIGGPVQENKEKARKASPLTYVSKDSAPFLIMHGDQDNTVPLNQSEVLAEALKKAGVEAKLVVVKGNGHGGPGFNSPENRKLIEDFFAKHLRKDKP